MKKLLIIITALAASTVWADKVNLKSGSFLTGTCGAITDDKMAFTSDDLGDIKIAVANIVSIESEKTHTIQHMDMTTEEAPVTIVNGTYVVNGENLNMDDVKAIDPVPEAWHGSVAASFLAQRGNTYSHTASVAADVKRRWEHDRFTASGEYDYAETGSNKDNKEKSQDEWLAKAQHDHFWSQRFYSYENGQYKRDVVADLNARYRIGLGLGYQWLENENVLDTGKWSFNQELGANYTKDRYELTTEEYNAIHYAHHATYNPIWSDAVDFFHNLEFDPSTKNFNNYTLDADVGMNIKITGNLKFTAKASWEYNSNPQKGTKKCDSKYFAGLGYEW